jgi:hypothetical protein
MPGQLMRFAAKVCERVASSLVRRTDAEDIFLQAPPPREAT